MKKVVLISLLITSMNLLYSCNKDDENVGSPNTHSEIIGSWKMDRHWGGIDGTETITFLSNSTYSVELERIEDFNGDCEFDPYCDNDYSGDYWFEGNKLYYNESTHEWTEYWNTWSVEGNLLHLDDDVYTRQ